jgi:type II secretory pathway component PulF
MSNTPRSLKRIAAIRARISGGAARVLRPLVARVRAHKAAYTTTKHKKQRGAGKRPAFLRFSMQDQIFFAKRLAMVLRSGMPIMEGLHMLGSETRTRSSTFIFQSLIFDVSNGHKLSSGLGKFQSIFGEFCVNVVRVGETSGTLHENLNYLADELKKKQALRRKVIGALIYPAVIVIATLGITVMLTVYIFPKIIPIFQSVKATLPLSTRMLMALSSFLSQWGLWLLLGIVMACVGFFFLMRLVPRFHLFMDLVLLRIPLLGKLSQYYNLANSARTLSLLLKSNVGVAYAMDLVAASTRNHAYRNAFYEAGERILKGQKISLSMQRHPRLFPPLMRQMITAGESTGNLSSSLMFLSDMYEEEISDLTKNLTTLLEPILMIVMGVIVGFIAISIITPIYSITQSITPN